METRISPTLAAAAAGIFSVASFAGRLATGVFGDRFDKRYVFAGITALSTAGIPLLILVHSFWVAIPVAVLIGIGMGGANPLRTALLADYFGTTSFGSINGIAMFVGTAGGFFGPLVVGVSVDMTDSYTSGWLLSAVMSALGIPAILLARAPADLIARHRARGQQVELAAAPDR
jgi:MFS family permease